MSKEELQKAGRVGRKFFNTLIEGNDRTEIIVKQKLCEMYQIDSAAIDSAAEDNKLFQVLGYLYKDQQNEVRAILDKVFKSQEEVSSWEPKKKLNIFQRIALRIQQTFTGSATKDTKNTLKAQRTQENDGIKEFSAEPTYQTLTQQTQELLRNPEKIYKELETLEEKTPVTKSPTESPYASIDELGITSTTSLTPASPQKSNWRTEEQYSGIEAQYATLKKTPPPLPKRHYLTEREQAQTNIIKEELKKNNKGHPSEETLTNPEFHKSGPNVSQKNNSKNTGRS